MANITERVRRFPRCRACHLPSGEDRRLIAGPAVYICESCIALLATGESAAAAAERCSFCSRATCRSPARGRHSPSVRHASNSHAAFWPRTIRDPDPPPNVRWSCRSDQHPVVRVVTSGYSQHHSARRQGAPQLNFWR